MWRYSMPDYTEQTFPFGKKKGHETPTQVILYSKLNTHGNKNKTAAYLNKEDI